MCTFHIKPAWFSFAIRIPAQFFALERWPSFIVWFLAGSINFGFWYFGLACIFHIQLFIYLEFVFERGEPTHSFLGVLSSIIFS